jgi:hypothetical protein
MAIDLNQRPAIVRPMNVRVGEKIDIWLDGGSRRLEGVVTCDCCMDAGEDYLEGFVAEVACGEAVLLPFTIEPEGEPDEEGYAVHYLLTIADHATTQFRITRGEHRGVFPSPSWSGEVGPIMG